MVCGICWSNFKTLGLSFVLYLLSFQQFEIFGCIIGHPWIREDGVAPDKPIDSAVLTRMKQFMAMNKMKKIALRVYGHEHLQITFVYFFHFVNVK